MSRKACLAFLPILSVAALSACSSPGYKTQQYAKQPNSKVFEYDYGQVWKGVKNAVSEYKLEEEDSETGRIKTDWIYSTSNEKYIEYTVNGFPRKRYLQTRFKYVVLAQRHMGGVKVTVNVDEEVENLKSDGSFDGWKNTSGDFDASRANELLRAIEMKMLSLPNK